MTNGRVRGLAPLLILPLCVLAPVLGRSGIGWLGNDVFLNVGLGVCFAAAALSLNMLMGYAGQISLGHFALLGVGALTSAILTSADRLGLPFVVALPAAAAMGALIAFLLGMPALRLRGLYLAVITIGFSYTMQYCVFRLHFIAKGSAGVELPRPIIGSLVLTRNADYLVVLLVLFAALWQFDRHVTRSKLGRAFQAIRSDEPMAASFGIDVNRYKLLAFALSGGMAGIAGAMYGHLIQFANSESFGYDRSLLLVVIVVVGGLASRHGVTISALFYALFPIYLVKWLGGWFRGYDLIFGAIVLMYAVSRHPGGLAEAWGEGRARREARAARRVAEAGRLDDEPDEVALPKLPDLPRPSGLADRPAEPQGTPLLSAQAISIRFGGLQALNAASIDVHRGRIVGLIGPNGAGKTTLFNAISGLLTPDRGTVRFLGQDVSRQSASARAQAGIGRTFQLIGLARDLSVTENLLLAQHVVAGYSTASALTRIGSARRVERELRKRADDAVAALGFEQYASTPVKRLSHGQQRIVELGCVLVTAPELVMLDEPSAGMSPGAAENLAVRLRDIRDELGRTVLLIEHNIPLVLDVCDELYVLAAGEILTHGAPGDVVAQADVVEAYLGEAVPV